MRQTLNEVGKILQSDTPAKGDKSFYGKVLSTITQDNKIVGYNVQVGDSTIEARKLAGAEVGNTVLCTTLSNGITVVTGTLNGDTDASTAIETAESVKTSTVDNDSYTSSSYASGRTIYKQVNSDGTYYYYWLDDSKVEHIVPESELDKDALGNVIVHKSLQTIFEEYQASNDSTIVSIQTALDNKATTSDITEQVQAQATTYDIKIGEVESAVENATKIAQDAQKSATQYDNYLKFDTSNGLQVGYTDSKSKVSITGTGVSMYTSEGEKAIDIQPAMTTIPTMETNYLYFGDFIIQYKPSTGEIICRKV